MNKPLRFYILAILVSFLACSSSSAVDFILNKTPAHVYFGPHGGCTEAITDAIGEAKAEVLVQAYSFTSAPIAQALLSAHKRGVKIEAILDKSQMKKEKYTSATFLANAGILTYIDDKDAIAHSKIMIIDRATVITGSFNFTKTAEEKAENLLIIDSSDLAKLYLENWTEHREHSEPYQAKY